MLAVTFCVLLPVAVLSAWIRGTVLSTSGYVAAVSPVAANPAVRTAVQDAVAAQVDEALHDVSGQLSRATGGAITLPPISGIPAAACSALAHVTHRPQAPECSQIPLFPAAALAGPRQVYRIVNIATALVLVLTVAAFASVIATAPRRARTVLQMAIGGMITALAARIAVSWLDSTLIDKSTARYQAVTGALVHALTSSFFTMSTWVLLGGVALTAGTVLAGPYHWATRLRTTLRLSR
jgi:hypothetical protein